MDSRKKRFEGRGSFVAGINEYQGIACLPDRREENTTGFRHGLDGRGGKRQRRFNGDVIDDGSAGAHRLGDAFIVRIRPGYGLGVAGGGPVRHPESVNAARRSGQRQNKDRQSCHKHSRGTLPRNFRHHPLPASSTLSPRGRTDIVNIKPLYLNYNYFFSSPSNPSACLTSGTPGIQNAFDRRFFYVKFGKYPSG